MFLIPLFDTVDYAIKHETVMNAAQGNCEFIESKSSQMRLHSEAI